LRAQLAAALCISVTDALALLLAAMIFAAAQKLLPLTEKAADRLTNFNARFIRSPLPGSWIVYITTPASWCESAACAKAATLPPR